jgi:hypothetical protein
MQPGSLYPQREPVRDDLQTTRKAIGVTLIAAGCLVALMVLQGVYALLVKSDQYPLIRKLTSEAAAIRTPQGDVLLPESLVAIGAHGLVIMLLLIASGIARAFLGTGAQLLQADVRTLLRELREEITRLVSNTPPPPSTPHLRS